MKNLTIGAQLIAEERQKQIDKHGFTAEHHVNHPEWYEEDQLKYAAKSILYPDSIHSSTPENWDKEWFEELMRRDNKERLVIAGALIAAELDRLSELEKQKSNSKLETKEITFSQKDIEQLQTKVHGITGDGEVMMLFNELLGVNAG